MFEVIFEILLELFAEILGQIIIEMGFESIGSLFKGEKESSNGFKIFGIILFASIVGIVSLFIFPYHLFKPLIFPGISLILSPLIVGYITYRIGRWKKENNKKATVLATFWGGASFAFIVALIRFIFL